MLFRIIKTDIIFDNVNFITTRAFAQIYTFTLYPGPKFTKKIIYPGPKFTHHQIYLRPKFTHIQIYP